jgi:L-ascorbate metabolism protein UlaG (beta-lactamase superfamily)
MNYSIIMKVIFLRHACFLVACNGTKLLFDPSIFPDPLAQKVDIDAIKADYVLLSHGHGDHMAEVEHIYHNHLDTITVNLEMVNWHEKIGIKKSLPIKPGGRQVLNVDAIKAAYGSHANAMPDGSDTGCAHEVCDTKWR